MNGADRREAMKRLFMTAWGLLTITLICCVAMLTYEMSRVGRTGTQQAPAAMPAPPPAQNAETPAQASDTGEIVLYFADAGGQRLAPESARVALGESTVDNCRRALEALIRGSQGVLAPVLPASVKIRGLYLLDGGELVADFSIDLETELRKARSASVESLMVYGVVDTLTQPALKGTKEDAVSRVRFLIEGAPPRDSFPAHLDLSSGVAPDPQWVAATQG